MKKILHLLLFVFALVLFWGSPNSIDVNNQLQFKINNPDKQKTYTHISDKKSLIKKIQTDSKALIKDDFKDIPKISIKGEVKRLIASSENTSTEITILETDNNKFDLYGLKDTKMAESGSTVNVEGYQIDGLFVAETVKTLIPPVREITGQQDVLAITFNWENDPSAAPFTQALITGQIFSNADSANSYYKQASNGEVSINGTVTNVTSSWLTIPFSSGVGCSYYGVGNLLDQWTVAARTAATDAGYNLASYAKFMYIFPYNLSCSWAGLGEVSGDETWYNGNNDRFVYSHELGHNFGAGHSSNLDCGASTIVAYASCTPGATGYEDAYDVMGGNGSWTNVFHMNAAWKNKAGWVPDGKVRTITTSGTYTIDDLESSTMGYHALKIAKPNTSDYYWFEYRQPTGFDINLPTGVTRGLIGRIYTDYFNTPYYNPPVPFDTYLLDMTPANNWSDIALTDGGEFYDSANKIRITQNSHDANSVTFNVNFEDYLIGSYNLGGVFYIENGYKRPIINSSIFNNWGFNWDNVYWAPLSTINTYPTGEPLTQLALYTGSVYLAQEGKLRPINDSDTFNIFKDNWGLGWGDIKKISANTYNLMTKGALITFPRLVTYSYGGSVYFMDDDGKRPIVDVDTFYNWGFAWINIFYTKNNTFLLNYPSPNRLTRLGSNNGSVYVIGSGSKMPVFSAQTFNEHSVYDPLYKWGNIVPISNNALNSLFLGPIIY